jgi:hypothetical protein
MASKTELLLVEGAALWLDPVLPAGECAAAGGELVQAAAAANMPLRRFSIICRFYLHASVRAGPSTCWTPPCCLRALASPASLSKDASVSNDHLQETAREAHINWLFDGRSDSDIASAYRGPWCLPQGTPRINKTSSRRQVVLRVLLLFVRSISSRRTAGVVVIRTRARKGK